MACSWNVDGNFLKTVETNDNARHGTNTSYLLNCWCVRTNPSSRIGNFTSQLPTMFWILKSRNLAGKPSFCTTRAYFLAANLDCSSLERRKVNERQIKEKAEENWEEPRGWGNRHKSWEHFIESQGIAASLLHQRNWLHLLNSSTWKVNKTISWPLGSSADHLSWAEDESSGPRFSYSHDDRSKTLQEIEGTVILWQPTVLPQISTMEMASVKVA